MKKIVTVGEILVEIMAREPGHGFGGPIDLVGPFPSGAPAIFISQAARLGQPCGIVGCVGDDDFGRLNVERLRCDGADVSAIAVTTEAVTGSAFVRYRPDGGRDFVFNIRDSACGRLARTPASDALVESADHVHVMGSALTAPPIVALALDAVERVKRRGGTVSFDPNLRPEIMGAAGVREALDMVLAQTDLFLPSGPELFLFTQEAEERAAVAELLDRGIRCVVVKRGADGASVFERGGAHHAPAFAVEEIDPTGAGDSFGGAFVAYWLRGLPTSEVLRRAAACGALAVGVRGPMEGCPTERELEAFLAERGGAA